MGSYDLFTLIDGQALKYQFPVASSAPYSIIMSTVDYWRRASCDNHWHVPTEHVLRIVCTCLREIQYVWLTPQDHYNSEALENCTENKMVALGSVSCDKQQKCLHLHFGTSQRRKIVLLACGIWHVCFWTKPIRNPSQKKPVVKIKIASVEKMSWYDQLCEWKLLMTE